MFYGERFFCLLTSNGIDQITTISFGRNRIVLMIYQNNSMQRSYIYHMLRGVVVVLLTSCIFIKYWKLFILLFRNIFTTHVPLRLLAVSIIKIMDLVMFCLLSFSPMSGNICPEDRALAGEMLVPIWVLFSLLLFPLLSVVSLYFKCIWGELFYYYRNFCNSW